MRFGKLTFLFFFSLALTLSAAPSPWDSWRAGYTTFELGEQWREKGNYTEALIRFQRAKKHYLAVRSARPDWNQRVIAERIAECERQIAAMEKLLKRGAGVVSPAEARPLQPSSDTGSTGNRKNETAAETAYAGTYHGESEWQAMRSERDALRRETAALKAELLPLKQQEKRQQKLETEISEMIRDRRITLEKYTLLEARCKELEAAAAKPDKERDELQKQLLAERMRAETAGKKAAAAETAKREAETRAARNEAARNAAEKVLRQAQEENLRLTKEREHLRNQEAAISRLKNDNAQILTRTDAELKRWKETCAETEAKMRKLREELTASEDTSAAKIKELRQKITDLTEKVNSSSRPADAPPAAEIQDLRLRCQKLLAEKEELSAAQKKERREAEAEREKYRTEGKNSLARLQEKEKEITALHATLDSLTELLQKTEKQLRKEENSCRTLRREAEKLRAGNTGNEKELATQRDRISALEKDLKEYSSRTEALQNRLKTKESEHFKRAAAANETCRRLEKDLAALQQELAASRGDADNAKQQLADKERQLKNLQTEILAERTKAIESEEKAKRLAASAEKAENTEKQLAELKKNFEALAAENRENRLLVQAAKPREAELSSIKLRLLEMETLKKNLLREQQLNEELRTSLRKMSQDAAALRKQTAELDSARRRIAELEALEGELQRLKALQKQYEKLNGREKELASLKIRLDEAVSRNQELARLAESRTEKLAALEKQNAVLKENAEEARRLKKQLQELKELSAAQSAELASLQENASSAAAENALSAKQKRELESLREAVKKLAPLNDEISRLNTACELSRQRTDELSMRIRSMEESMTFKENEIVRLRRLNRELADFRENSSRALKEKAEEARFSRLTAEIQALQKLNASLSAERDRLQRRLEEVAQGIAVPADARPAPAASAEELASAGAIAEADGKWESAIWNYQQALAANADFLSARERLGKLLFQKKRCAEALPHLSTVLAADPGNTDLAILTASCQIALKRFGNARTILEPLLQKHPENSRLQMAAGAVCAASGEGTQAEERFVTAARLAPKDPEPLLALARFLASQPERTGEAVTAYEKARELGSAPEPSLEKALAKMLDQRRETVRFFFSAAQEAELSGDWSSALWYYRKLVDIGKEEFIPHTAFAQWKSGKSGAARETLEFHAPSPLGMAVLTLIELSENHEDAALLAARRTAGARVGKWLGMNLEMEKLSSLPHPSGAVRMLLVNLKNKQE